MKMRYENYENENENDSKYRTVVLGQSMMHHAKNSVGEWGEILRLL